MLVASERGERAEVVLDLGMTVQPVPSGEAADFRWDEVGEWIYDAGTQELSRSFLSDPAPMVLAARTARAPVLLFIGPSGWSFEAGLYTIEVAADRAVAGRPVTTSLTVSLTAESVRLLNESGGRRFLTFPSGP